MTTPPSPCYPLCVSLLTSSLSQWLDERQVCRALWQCWAFSSILAPSRSCPASPHLNVALKVLDSIFCFLAKSLLSPQLKPPLPFTWTSAMLPYPGAHIHHAGSQSSSSPTALLSTYNIKSDSIYRPLQSAMLPLCSWAEDESSCPRGPVVKCLLPSHSFFPSTHCHTPLSISPTAPSPSPTTSLTPSSLPVQCCPCPFSS